jgi:plasmid rolling circle replication initiator protein Rep
MYQYISAYFFKIKCILTNTKNGCIVDIADIKLYTPSFKELNPLQDYNSISVLECQVPPEQADRLEDFVGGMSWRDRKVVNEYLALAFRSFDKRKAERLRDCSTFLQFKIYQDGTKKLNSMNSCHVRLCPICSWRRSLKTYSNIRKVTEYLHDKEQRQFVFVTLTVENCQGEDLSRTLDMMFQAFNRFNQLKDFKKAFTGFYRALEITRNSNPLSKNYGTYHPHFHCVFSVKKSYFTSRYYLSQQTIAELWQQSLRVNYLPVVDVRKVRGSLAKSCAEVAKYSVKTNDIIVPDDWNITCETAELLDRALERRRLISYGGELAKVRRLLRLEDEENGDLVHIDEDVPTEEDYKIVNYFWFSGVRDYYGI